VTPGDGIEAALVVLALAVLVASAVGLVGLRTPLDRLHLVSAISVLPPTLVAVAVLIRESFHMASVKAFTVAAIMIVVGPVIVHATAQAVHESAARDAEADRRP
jgi:multisubunit Na+/H+ antiporter MnhG subunit